MKTNTKWVAALASTLILMSACSNLTNSTANSKRTITGNVSNASTASLNPALLTRTAFAAESDTSTCVADALIATDVSGNTVVSSVDDVCDFSLDLDVNTPYVISLTENGGFVAILIFDSGVTGFTSSVLTLSELSSIVDLGQIIINGTTATPENNPLSYSDLDDDGENDLIDNDDDDDGVFDHEERDCDLDGFLDDDDHEYSEDHSDVCSSAEGEFVTRVKPYDEGESVDLDKEIKIYTSCALDETSVSEATVVVSSEAGDVLTCNFEINSDDEHNEVKCSHEETPFVADTVYTVSVEGLKCADGTDVTATAWTFSTEASDDDEGDYEDEYDAEDAMESEDTEDHLSDAEDEADTEDQAEDETETQDETESEIEDAGL